MTIYEHILEGCAPVPLAGYLKALGILRLVAEQADQRVRGFWRDERFVLRTRLTRDALIHFFLDAWQPTPVVAPWNAGSGFWPKDNREGFNAIKTGNDKRLHRYRHAIGLCEELIAAKKSRQAPKEEDKANLISSLRAVLPDDACLWLDGAIALTLDGPRYPPILGTGGNDGRLDFSNNFMRRVAECIVSRAEVTRENLLAALFYAPAMTLEQGAVGQFSPGTAGGVNAGVGFEAASRVNPWDFILTVEGALVFASAAVRRNAQDRADAFSFPFTTRTVGAGTGAAVFADEADSRAEFWAPLWLRAAGIDEVLHLMSEGRAVLNGRAARDGFDFSRAAAALGVASGIDAFVRHAFLMRAGKAFFAVPLNRVQVKDNPTASLISDLDVGGWLMRARQVGRYAIKNGRLDRSKEAPASLSKVGRAFDEALFRMSSEATSGAVENALIAFGIFMLEIARRPKLHEILPPPPHLSPSWATAVDDGSHEFALAEALASLEAQTADFRLPFRCHLASLGLEKGRASWSDKTEALALSVWSGRNLIRDMGAVLERRLIEAQRCLFIDRAGNRELPLRGRRSASLASVSAFLAKRTDDDRIGALAAGLAWVEPRTGSPMTTDRPDALPFAYSVLKPLFAPSGFGPLETDQRKHVHPLPLLRLLRAGRTSDAIASSQATARSCGLPTPFAHHSSLSMAVDTNRLAAGILFPIVPVAHERLIERAYPDLKEERKEELHVD